MKTLRFLFTAIWLVFSANAGEMSFTAISFTNKLGHVVTNARILKVDEKGVLYSATNGLDRVAFVDLPTDYYDHFKNVIPKVAVKKPVTKAAKVARVMPDLPPLSDKEIRLSEIRFVISGETVQILPDGILMDGYIWKAQKRRRIAEKWEDESLFYEPDFTPMTDKKLFFLKGMDTKDMVDGEKFRAVAYRTGTYRYQAVIGSVKTVACLTASRAAAWDYLEKQK